MAKKSVISRTPSARLAELTRLAKAAAKISKPANVTARKADAPPPPPRGRPRSANPRAMLAVRVDPKLIEIIKSCGAGYSAKVEAALWKAASQGAFGRAGGARK